MRPAWPVSRVHVAPLKRTLRLRRTLPPTSAKFREHSLEGTARILASWLRSIPNALLSGWLSLNPKPKPQTLNQCPARINPAQVQRFMSTLCETYMANLCKMQCNMYSRWHLCHSEVELELPLHFELITCGLARDASNRNMPGIELPQPRACCAAEQCSQHVCCSMAHNPKKKDIS